MNKDFRAAYYGTLGVKTVAAKASLDAALGGDSNSLVSVDLLKAVCRAAKIPRKYRSLVWKLVLGVTPPAKNAWNFVDEQQRQTHDDLVWAQHVLFPAGSANNSDIPDVMIRMRSVHSSSAPGLSLPRNYLRVPHLYCIADCILEVCDGIETDAYWIFKHFVDKMNVAPSIDRVVVGAFLSSYILYMFM
ncbi:TBC1 domain member 7 [Physocladia obscura]|uniref:TBC1 domain member 7 n=1 Tax=Physocladia obscura TaxID=109957 RepID=A0AAD5SS60_9FUNG|nr:TBC1 domain member 7 [Physocladia obscura]